MPITPRKVRLVFGPFESQATDKSLVPPTSAQIYLTDKTTVATIYSNTTGSALTNSPSIPTGVATGAPGLDAYGNIVFYGDPGTDYAVLVNSLFLPVPVTGIHGTDFTDHLGITGSVTDPHGDRAYADTNKVDKTTLGVAGGTATLDSNGWIPAAQIVID